MRTTLACRAHPKALSGSMRPESIVSAATFHEAPTVQDTDQEWSHRMMIRHWKCFFLHRWHGCTCSRCGCLADAADARKHDWGEESCTQQRCKRCGQTVSFRG